MDITRAGSGAAAVWIAGLAVGDAAATAALADAGVAGTDIAAVIHVAPSRSGPGDERTAAAIGAALRLGGPSGEVRALDLVDDGCGVPSSIAVGMSLTIAYRGMVLVTASDCALVLGGRGRPFEVGCAAPSSGEFDAAADVVQSAVDQILRTVPAGLPVVAAVPASVRLPAGVDRADSTPAAQIGALVAARTAGSAEVALMAAGAAGRSAAVVCRFLGVRSSGGAGVAADR